MRRKYIAAIIVLGMAAALLGACAKKDSAGGTSQAPSGSGGQSGSGVEVVEPDNAAANTSQDAAQNNDNNEANAAEEVDISNTYDIANQSGEAPAPEAANETASGWDGTFSGGDGETLTLSRADEYSLSFSFAVSGISGTADLEGDYAVYHGDDDHDVSFSLSGNTVSVSVTLTEDGSTEESPINGTYTRNA